MLLCSARALLLRHSTECSDRPAPSRSAAGQGVGTCPAACEDWTPDFHPIQQWRHPWGERDGALEVSDAGVNRPMIAYATTDVMKPQITVEN